MKMRKQFAVCAAAMVTASLTAGTTVMASSDKAFSIDMSENAEAVWDCIAMTNDDTVYTGVNIRSSADENGEVVACLYRGGAVEVLYRGDVWSEVRSGDVTGYVRNEYLMYGSEAKGLADYYGVEGVEASWDDVNVFEYADANAPILASVEDGQTFQVVSDEGHWIGIQFGADQLAYVSEEDVKRVLLVDEAVPLGEISGEDGSDTETASYEEDYDTSYDDGYTDDTYTDDSYTDDSYTDDGYTDDSYTDDGSADDSYTDDGSADDGYTDDSYTDDGSADDGYTDDSYTDDGSADDSYTDDVYTDDTTDYTDDTVYDDAENVETVDGAEEYTDEEYAEDMSDMTYDDSADGSYEETQDTSYTEETEAAADSGASASSGDLDLMAAIIYCEAGNQSYEGMVAVGAVVMNRVASSSFPNTVSEVIYQSGQFTPASSGALASALANGVPSTCYDAAAAAMAGENPVGSALYFNAGSGSGMQIGDHQFY